MLMSHNIPVFQSLENILSQYSCCCVVMGTGCGKTYVAVEYLNKYNLKALVVAPRNSICDSWSNHTDKVDTITYQKLSISYKDIDFTKYDVVICDEVHHIGAPRWGAPIKYLIDNKLVKVIGLTESSVRYSDGGRDVAEEFFYGNIVYGESVSSAIDKKILNPVTYVGAMYNSDGLKKTLRGKIQSRLYAKLNLVLNNTPDVTEILKKHMLPGKRKGIIFASSIEDIESAISFVKSVYPDVEIKHVHSKQASSYNEDAMQWFKDTDEGYLCSVDMISEGVHIKGVNTLIMLRRTESVNLFNQQLGRCLDANSKEPAILFDLVNNKHSIRIIQNKVRVKTNTLFDSIKISVAPSSQLIVHDYTKDILDILEEIKISLNGSWSEEEDNILRKYYPTEGSDCYDRFINRTKIAVMQRASILGITYTEHSWTEEELNIVKEYYPSEGSSILSRLPGKTLYAVKAQARRMKVYSKAFLKWTDEEIKIIKDNYAELGGLKLQELIPNHSATEIMHKAKSLGIKKTTKKVMCIELEQVFDNAKEAARQLNISNKYANTSILECCRGKLKSAYGYHWKFV